ncbi:N-acetylmuramoyl-L-alanine amidase [Methylocapsa acidiphila]|uniref:N-acetylmuramoyl-L-alanine amidase n=1 Tax=Methylocapsa acidiphila TaxID=133552 RepID=UPI0009FFF6E0|nr:N-acetylmuramoyl-L-alanine amidase [Methylocapsa acidiphila]
MPKKNWRICEGLGRAIGVGAICSIAAWLAVIHPLRAEPQEGANAAAAPASAEPGARAVASAARLEQGGGKAKLIFTLSAPVSATAFVLSHPARVIVDLPQIDFALDPQIGKPAAAGRRRHRRGGSAELVASFRFGQLGQGKSRVVVDLGGPTRVVKAVCEESGGEQRLVIELARTSRQNFRTAVQEARAALAGQSSSVAPHKVEAPQKIEAAGKQIVVIDPGHGGIDSGAMVKGLVEKTLVFEFAKAVQAKLEADGRFAVVLTRQDDSFVPLSARVRMAREGNAALFVSIHADTLSDASDVSGATVYTASDRASDAEAARVAEKENQSDAVAGLEGAEDSGDVSDILFDLTRRETRAYSHVFARTLVNYWKVAARLNKNPQRSAGFRVLKAPDVPSVLLELGYLSNEKDHLALNSPEWREQASSRVVEAIEAFFSERGVAAPPRTSAPSDRDDGDSAATASIPPPAVDMAHKAR